MAPMQYKNNTQRIIRTVLGIGLLVYIFTNAKMSYWLPFYTFHTNVFVGAWYILAGLLPGKNQPALWLKDSVKGSITTYITITGLVYNAVLIPVEREMVGYIPFVSIVTHIFVPLLMIADYLLTPTVEKPKWKNLPGWLSYPLAYAAITLIHGAISNFYPYPFIDPNQVQSTGMLIFNYSILILIHAGIAALYLFAARKKAHQGKTHPDWSPSNT